MKRISFLFFLITATLYPAASRFSSRLLPFWRASSQNAPVQSRRTMGSWRGSDQSGRELNVLRPSKGRHASAQATQTQAPAKQIDVDAAQKWKPQGNSIVLPKESFNNRDMQNERAALVQWLSVQENRNLQDTGRVDETRVISQVEKYEPEPYEELDTTQKKMVSSEQYDAYIKQLKNLDNVEIQHIKYEADGHQVEGFVLLPKHIEPEQYKELVLYNRGGHRNWGKNDLMTFMDHIVYLVQAGYPVVASQYRGTIAPEVKDEFGGIDVQDNLSLLQAAHELGLKTDDIMLLGFSRGGIMAFRTAQELDDDVNVRAYATIGSPSHMESYLEENPKFIQPLLEDAIEDFHQKYEQECTKRSVCSHADVLDDIPVLLIHASEDEDGKHKGDPVVPTSQARRFDKELKKREQKGQRKAKHKLLLYPERAHPLKKHNAQAQQEILSFFNEYSKKINQQD